MDIGRVAGKSTIPSAHRNQHAFKPEVDRARFDPSATSANGVKPSGWEIWCRPCGFSGEKRISVVVGDCLALSGHGRVRV